jgi:hypothetical protein
MLRCINNAFSECNLLSCEIGSQVGRYKHSGGTFLKFMNVSILDFDLPSYNPFQYVNTFTC